MHLLEYRVIEGRRPEGLVMPKATPLAPVLGDYFARAAHLDAASAVAYARLRRELDAYGAPKRLLDACERARTAELRHARELGSLAERFDVQPRLPKVRELVVRPLVDVAIENVIEGCVRTTYGAAAAKFRARAARDPDIRAVMEGIAKDEGAHAELAFEIARWLQTTIDPIEGALVEDSMRHAVRALVRELDVERDPALCAAVGVPSRRDSLAIWSGLAHRVWHGMFESVWRAAEAA